MDARARRNTRRTERILFVGFNTLSAPLIHALNFAPRSEDFQIFVYTTDFHLEVTDAGADNAHQHKRGHHKPSIHRRASKGGVSIRRRSSAGVSAAENMRRRMNEKKNDAMSDLLHKCLGYNEREKSLKNNITVLTNQFDLQHLANTFGIVFYCSSRAFLFSQKGMALKRSLSGSNAIWVHISHAPELKCLDTDGYKNTDRIKLLGVPLYSVSRSNIVKNDTDVKYWYGWQHPVHMKWPFPYEPLPRVVNDFFVNLESRGIKLRRTPPIHVAKKRSRDPKGVRGIAVRVEDLKEAEYLRNLLLDFDRRICLLPIFLQIEYEFYVKSRAKSRKKRYRDAEDIEVEKHRLQQIVYDAFLELKGASSGILGSIFDSCSMSYLADLKSLLIHRMTGEGEDNKNAIDVVDAMNRIIEFRHEIKAVMGNRRMRSCQTLLRETDITKQVIGGKIF